MIEDKTSRSIKRNQNKKKVEEKIEAERKRIEKSICETFSTESGRQTLHWLMKFCGYQSPTVVINPKTNKLQHQTMVHNEAMRGVYLEIRKQLRSRPDILKIVEIEQLKGE